MATIEVDGKTYEVEDGKNLLDACLGLGLDLPYFCWHPALGSVGSCRQCAVRVYANADDQRGRLVMSCMTPVADGQRLSITEPDTQAFRDKSIEVTMANHPHDCPVCEEGGECHLQDMTIMSRHTERRYRGLKKTYKNQYLGPCISHEMNRCIACYRCVRFYNDYAGGDDLAALASRENVYFGRHEDGCLESVFSGNLVEVCPTGVFTDKTLGRSYNRKWDLQSAPSICGGCSLGCNISPGERQGRIKRIVNRYHHDINSYFICDRGRFGYDHANNEQRILDCSIRHTPESTEEAPDYNQVLDIIAGHLATAFPESVIAIGSDRASVEVNFALQSLVGVDNFYSGLATGQQQMLGTISEIYRQPYVQVPTLREMEAADAVLVLGEDLINSAPRMALSVRQATRNLSFALARQSQIPLWQDDSVRTLAQAERSPLIIASSAPTDLDAIASQTLRVDPDNIARLGFAIAHCLSDQAPPVDGLDSELRTRAQEIANTLLAASNPLIISGTSCNSPAVIEAAAQVAQALSIRSSNGAKNATALSYVLPAANSLGLALLQENQGNQHLDAALQKVLDNPGYYTAVIVQNDLYQRAAPERLDRFFRGLKRCIVIDQQPSRTTGEAQILVPATTDFETEGTLVNNEGRAQRFFEVFCTDNPALKDNWKSLVNIATGIVSRCGSEKMPAPILALSQCTTFDDLTRCLAQRGGLFTDWDQVAPGAGFRIAGMKVPRMPHRFSGRTSLRANIRVAEAKQPEDADSALGFTMEGAPVHWPGALSPITWAPRWNSNEAVNKFQDEINGHLKGGDPGLRLFSSVTPDDHSIDSADDSAAAAKAPFWFNTTIAASGIGKGQLLAVSTPRLFDGEPLSAMSSALFERAERPVLQVNPRTATRYGMVAGNLLRLALGSCHLQLQLRLNADLPDDLVAVPADVTTCQTLPAVLLPALVEIEA